MLPISTKCALPFEPGTPFCRITESIDGKFKYLKFYKLVLPLRTSKLPFKSEENRNSGDVLLVLVFEIEQQCEMNQMNLKYGSQDLASFAVLAARLFSSFEIASGGIQSAKVASDVTAGHDHPRFRAN